MHKLEIECSVHFFSSVYPLKILTLLVKDLVLAVTAHVATAAHFAKLSSVVVVSLFFESIDARDN
jgi:hypothetical protein